MTKSNLDPIGQPWPEILSRSATTGLLSPIDSGTNADLPDSEGSGHGGGEGDGGGGDEEDPCLLEPVEGTNAADTMVGAGGSQHLVGLNGDDSLYGLGGADCLEGGNGDDLLDGGPGRDFLKGGNGRDVLIGGAGRDDLFGGNGDDQLSGGAGPDALDGGRGDDLLSGGVGSDRLTGGSGADLFVISGRGGEADVITDFKNGDDRFMLTDGLVYEDLSFSGSGIYLGSISEAMADPKSRLLVVVEGLDTTQLRSSDFISAPPDAMAFLLA